MLLHGPLRAMLVVCALAACQDSQPQSSLSTGGMQTTSGGNRASTNGGQMDPGMYQGGGGISGTGGVDGSTNGQDTFLATTWQGGSVKTGGSPQSSGGTGGNTQPSDAATGGLIQGGTVTTGGTGNPSGGTSNHAGGSSHHTGGNHQTGGTGQGGSTASEFAPCPATGTCKILPLGDSITDGSFNKYAGAYRIQLFTKASQSGKNITFVGSSANGPTTVDGKPFPRNHEGHIGWTINQISGLVPSPALKDPPHIVLLMAGTNDVLWQDTTMADAPNRFGTLLDKIITAVPDALIAVAQLTPLTGGTWAKKDSMVQTYNAALTEVANKRIAQGKHVVVVDMHALPSSEIADGIHPNETGYTHMGNIWYAAISKYLH